MPHFLIPDLNTRATLLLHQIMEMNGMLISTKGRYAVRMLLDIAVNQKDSYVPMKDIARRQQISKKYLETFTTQLIAAEILGVRRGKTGGYRLLRDPSQITLLEVIHTTGGPLHAVACLECEPNRCPRSDTCMTLPAWKGLEAVIRDYLSSVTLQNLIDRDTPYQRSEALLPENRQESTSPFLRFTSAYHHSARPLQQDDLAHTPRRA